MSNVAAVETVWPDEAPTAKRPGIGLATISLAMRVDRLAELAAERLQYEPDELSIATALEDLATIRALAGQVLK